MFLVSVPEARTVHSGAAVRVPGVHRPTAGPRGVAPAALGQVGSSLTGPGCASVSEKLWQRGVHDKGRLGHAGFGERGV